MYQCASGPVTDFHIKSGIHGAMIVYPRKEPVYGVQTSAVPAGSGTILEFYIPEEGVYPFVDHEKLAYLSYGLALPFATANVNAMAH